MYIKQNNDIIFPKSKAIFLPIMSEKKPENIFPKNAPKKNEKPNNSN